MKNIKLLLGLLLVALVIGCEHEYEQPNEFSDVQWYNSMFRGENKTVGLEKYHSFSDLSRGAVEHTWSIEGVVGGHFLEGPISNADTSYYQFIKEGAGAISEDETVHVLFTKPGEQGVRLYNAFKDYVKFEGNDTIESVYDSSKDLWVIDTTFVVDVYDTIQPALKVYRDMEETILLASHAANEPGHEAADSINWTNEVTIMAGESLKFVDLTEMGRPDARTWAANGGKPGFSSDSIAQIFFNRMGRFYVAMDSRRTGQHVPYGYRRQWVPLKINVIKSTLPFEVVGEGVELFDETIQLSFNGEVNNFTNEEDNFIVKVTNPNGFDSTIPVQSAKVNSSDGTIIDLVLESPIYNTDNILVSYTGGNIESADERDLNTFTDVAVKMYAPNLIPNSGFESAGQGWMIGYDHAIDNVAEFVTTDPSVGAYAYHTQILGAGRGSVYSPEFTLKSGVQYKLSWDRKTVNTNGYWNGYEVRFAKKSFFNTDTGGEETGPVQKFWMPQRDANSTWETEEKIFSFPADTGDDYIIHLLAYVANADLYFDNFVLYIYEERPTE